MDISISNIAWNVELDNDVALLLSKLNIRNIDIAPSKYFPFPHSASTQDVRLIKEYWLKRGVNIAGMQSLLFGTNGLNVFSNSNIQQEMMLHLTHIFRIAQQLNAKFLVFGSPLNRDRSHLSDHRANTVAQRFFSHLGDIAQSYGVTICLEPNPTCYNCNFMTNSKETASIVKLVNHENIKMQLDVGAMYTNNEDPELIVPEVAHLIGHIHISEPRLATLNPDNDYHAMVAPLINKYLADKILTIEMLTSSKKATLDEVEESLKFVKNTYLPEQSL